jgi:hypothetical protein
MPIAKFHSPPEEMTEENSGISSPWSNYLTLTTQTLQRHFNESGLLVNIHSAANEALLNVEQNRGKFSFNNDTSEMKVNQDGTYKPVAVVTERLPTAEIAARTIPANNGKFYEDINTNTLHYVLNGVLKEVTLT